MPRFLRVLLLTLTLAGAAQAAPVYRFEGVTDSGVWAGEPVTGEFGFEAVAADFDGAAPLTALQLWFRGQLFTLAQAATPAQAWFGAGQLLGVDFVDSLETPQVALTAGFFAPDEAFFQYFHNEGGGFASLRFEAVQAVALPGAAGLGLIGLLALGLSRRRAAR